MINELSDRSSVTLENRRPALYDRALGGFSVLQIVAGLDPVYGGPSYSIPRLCEALAVAGADTALLSVCAAGARESDTMERGYRDRRFSWDWERVPVLRRLRHSSRLSRALNESAGQVDIVHDHGLWLLPNVFAGRAAAIARTPLVVSPRGMLSSTALNYSRVTKRVFWRLLQEPVIRKACFHATSTEERDDIRAIGLTGPVAIVRNGIDLPDPWDKTERRGDRKRILLSLGRIHPQKGLDRLLRAWSRVEAAHPDWWLRIVGPAERRHDEELRALARALGLDRISIEGPVYGDAKDAVYREANLFILPTLSESFGISIAEALAAGVPVISTRGAPWAGLETEGCGWWVENGVEPLTVALASAVALPPAVLRRMGTRGRAWMARDFSWDRVAIDMLAVYRWLACGAERPDTVRID